MTQNNQSEGENLQVSHGGTTHPMTESEQCESCIKTMKEFEQAKADGSLEKILSEEEKRCNFCGDTGLVCGKKCNVCSPSSTETAELKQCPECLTMKHFVGDYCIRCETAEGWETRLKELYIYPKLLENHLVGHILLFMRGEIEKARSEGYEKGKEFNIKLKYLGDMNIDRIQEQARNTAIDECVHTFYDAIQNAVPEEGELEIISIEKALLALKK